MNSQDRQAMVGYELYLTLGSGKRQPVGQKVSLRMSLWIATPHSTTDCFTIVCIIVTTGQGNIIIPLCFRRIVSVWFFIILGADNKSFRWEGSALLYSASQQWLRTPLVEVGTRGNLISPAFALTRAASVLQLLFALIPPKENIISRNSYSGLNENCPP